MRWSLLAVVVAALLVISIQAWSGPPVGDCRDTVDNDGDGHVDMDDPGCADPFDLSEKSPSLVCDDGEDNDSDGYVDLDDEDCFDLWHPTEYPASCNDGEDNDGDGYIDLMDLGCEDIWDDCENCPSWVCDDGLDNDGDGYIDMEDPGCYFIFDPTETDPELPCDDGLDGDGDGLIDHANDPGCSEDPFNFSEVSDCYDGHDNEGDGLYDGYYGFGLSHPCSIHPGNGVNGTSCDPACGGSDVGSNGQRADHPEDTECDNGEDDDGDGYIDLKDPDCINPTCRREDGLPVLSPLYPRQHLYCKAEDDPTRSCGIGPELLLMIVVAWTVRIYKRSRA